MIFKSEAGWGIYSLFPVWTSEASWRWTKPVNCLKSSATPEGSNGVITTASTAQNQEMLKKPVDG